MVGNGSSSGGIGTSGFFVLFGADTGRTDIKDLASMIGSRTEVRNALDPFVGIIEIVVRDVAKALMPEKTGGFSGDRRYWCSTLNILMERKGMKLRREIGEIRRKRIIGSILMSEDVVDGRALTINTEVGITEKSKATGVSWRSQWVTRVQIGKE